MSLFLNIYMPKLKGVVGPSSGGRWCQEFGWVDVYEVTDNLVQQCQLVFCPSQAVPAWM